MSLSKRKIVLGVFTLFILIVISFITIKKISPIAMKIWGENNLSSGIALNGFDAVAYQTLSKALKGDAQYVENWQDSQWYFSNEENKALFEQSPEKFAPSYGGYCSFAVSKGVTADVNPKVWHIADNKLYLFMDEEVKSDWLKSNGVLASDRNWQM